MPAIFPQMGHHMKESEKKVFDVCYNLDFNKEECAKIIQYYCEPHRHYHNLDHIADIIEQFEIHHYREFSDEERKILYYAAIFHDIVYDPLRSINEEDSVNVMRIFLNERESEALIDRVANIILVTQNHSKYKTKLETCFCKMDLNGFEQSFMRVLEDERKIRKEYAWVDWAIYQSSRQDILGKFLSNDLLTDQAKRNIEFEIDYLKFCQPNIAVYPGSFNPFHIGHLHILEKAERIFDKVIVAMGHNPEKKFKARAYDESPCVALKYRQVDFYDGLLTDYIQTKPYPVTVIRGLRNTTDMMAEINQYRWLQELSDNKINVVSIFCDKEYEHISSTSLRSIEQYNPALYEKYIVK